jgi:hypothetical protein
MALKKEGIVSGCETRAKLSRTGTCIAILPAVSHLEQQAIPRAAIPDSTNHFSLVNTLGESEFDLACSIEGFQLFGGEFHIQTGEIVLELRYLPRVGIWLGQTLTRKKPAVIIKEVPAQAPVQPMGPFVADETRVSQLGITPREMEILGLIATGLNNREIAGRLFVSENTVKTHSSRLFRSLTATPYMLRVTYAESQRQQRRDRADFSRSILQWEHRSVTRPSLNFNPTPIPSNASLRELADRPRMSADGQAAFVGHHVFASGKYRRNRDGIIFVG